MPARPTPLVPSAESRPGGPTPTSLLYTLLRHGRGLPHEEAHRRSREICGAPERSAA